MKLGREELTSIFYHDIFDYPLNIFDLIRWRAGKKARPKNLNFKITQDRGYLFVKGRKGLIFKRIIREKNFQRKKEIAGNAARLLSKLPTIKAVGITGSLAMQNAKDSSDIDFLVITQRGTLWTTRLLSFLLLKLAGIPTRRFGDRVEKDKICLNLWLDETVLSWPKGQRNVYTAHEIAQIISLIDKDKVFEKFLWLNRWTEKYWPNAVGRTHAGGHIKYIGRKELSRPKTLYLTPFLILEPLARDFQFLRMRRRITRETVSKKKALFHPQDWGEVVAKRFV